MASLGTNIGGGTFWGLCKLLTGMDNFDDILSLSSEGDNSNVRQCLLRPVIIIRTKLTRGRYSTG
jgi:pantothenate kinase